MELRGQPQRQRRDATATATASTTIATSSPGYRDGGGGGDDDDARHGGTPGDCRRDGRCRRRPSLLSSSSDIVSEAGCTDREQPVSRRRPGLQRRRGRRRRDDENDGNDSAVCRHGRGLVSQAGFDGVDVTLLLSSPFGSRSFRASRATAVLATVVLMTISSVLMPRCGCDAFSIHSSATSKTASRATELLRTRNQGDLERRLLLLPAAGHSRRRRFSPRSAAAGELFLYPPAGGDNDGGQKPSLARKKDGGDAIGRPASAAAAGGSGGSKRNARITRRSKTALGEKQRQQGVGRRGAAGSVSRATSRKRMTKREGAPRDDDVGGDNSISRGGADIDAVVSKSQKRTRKKAAPASKIKTRMTKATAAVTKKMKAGRTGGTAAAAKTKAQQGEAVISTGKRKKDRFVGEPARAETGSSPGEKIGDGIDKKKKPRKYKPVPSDMALQNVMQQHGLLSKEEEMRLGRAMDRAKQVRERIDQILAEKENEQGRRRRQICLPDDDENEDDDDAYDIDYSALYGDNSWSSDDGDPAPPEAYTRLEEKERTSLLYRYQRRSLDSEDRQQQKQQAEQYRSHPIAQDDLVSHLLGEGDANLGDGGSTGLSLPSNFIANAGTNDASMFDEDDDEKISSLSDDDIVTGLGMVGGRAELYDVLLFGAVARETLVRRNMRLVVSIAKRWCRQMMGGGGTSAASAATSISASSGTGQETLRSVYNGRWDRPSLDETIQEGLMGLLTAADRYEPDRGHKFSTYATFWITNRVRRCFQDLSMGGGAYRVPVAFHDIKTKYKALLKEHFRTSESRKMPPLEVMADRMGIKRKRLELVLRTTRFVTSADAPYHISTGGTGNGPQSSSDSAILVIDTVVDESEPSGEESIDRSFLRQSLENALATELAPHERDVIRLRLGLDDGVTRTAKEVAVQLGASEDGNASGGGASSVNDDDDRDKAATLSEGDIRSTELRAYKKLRSPQSLATHKLMSHIDLVDIDRATMKLR